MLVMTGMGVSNGAQDPGPYVVALQLTGLQMKKASEYRYLEAFVLFNGRGERIRTFDPLVPNQMRYQAALRPDEVGL